MENKHKKKLVRILRKGDFEILNALSLSDIKQILIYKDWLGTGGKLGYEPLAEKYDLTISKVRTICSKFNKPANI
jgi:hypothetical protein